MKHFVCIGSGRWCEDNGQIESTGPKYGEIVTYDGDDNPGYMFLVEYPEIGYDGTRGSFNKKSFRPVDETFGEWVEETVLKEAVLEHALA